MDELWLATGGRTVPQEWIDYNGHMMDAYYFLAFTEATEAFLDHVGLGAAYRARTGRGVYTAEGHLCFLSGVTGGAALSYQTQLLDHDAKRLHVFHQMTSAGTPGRDLRADVPARQRRPRDADAARGGPGGQRAGRRARRLTPPPGAGRPPHRQPAAAHPAGGRRIDAANRPRPP